MNQVKDEISPDLDMTGEISEEVTLRDEIAQLKQLIV